MRTLLLCIFITLVSCEKQDIDGDFNMEEKTVYDSCFPHGSKDYLHEEWFPCDSSIVYDHYVTKKYATIIIPYVNEILIASGSLSQIDLHNVDIHIYNPYNGDSVTFLNIFNYIDDEGIYNPFFNLNKLVSNKWGYHSGTKTFLVSLIHRSTGINIGVTYDGNSYITMHFNGL